MALAAMQSGLATLSFFGGGQTASGIDTSRFNGPIWAAAVHEMHWKQYRGKILDVWDASNPNIRTKVAIIDICAASSSNCRKNVRPTGFVIDIVKNGIGALGLTVNQGLKRVGFRDTGASVLNQFRWNAYN